MTNLVLLEQEVDLDPKLIPALAERLAQKRASLEKEIDALGEEPKNQGIAAIFTQCRGFATVFEKLINDTDKAARIRELFHGDGGLLGKVKKINWKKEFRPEVVKRVCKTADGYQPHLISPEKGLQTLASDALERIKPLVQETVVLTHQLLVDAAREAAGHASEGTDMGQLIKVKSRLPRFESAIMSSVIKALEEWKEDGMEKAMTLVEMEKAYLSISFFRATMHERVERERRRQEYEKQKQQEEERARKNKKSPSQTSQRTSVSDEHFRRQSTMDSNVSDEDEELTYRAGASAHATSAPTQQSNKPVELKAIWMLVQKGEEFTEANSPPGYMIGELWKRKSENSALGAIGSEIGKWQKRYFVLHISNKELYYFQDLKQQNFVTTPSKRILLDQIVVEDVDVNETKMPSELASDKLSDGDKVSKIIRLRHRDPRQSVIKDHPQILLCASSAAAMYQWKACFRGIRDPNSGQMAQISHKHKQEADEDLFKVDYDDLGFDISPVDGCKPDGLGLASPYFKAKQYRTRTGRLLPSPGLLVVSDVAKKNPKNAEEHILKEFGQDIAVYCEMVCDTITTTVPKAIVYCQIKKAQDELLIHMQNHIIRIQQENPTAIDDLLEEDPEFGQRREVAKLALQDLRTAIYNLRDIQDGKAPLRIPAKYAVWTDTREMVPKELQRFRDFGILIKEMYGKYAPEALLYFPEQLKRAESKRLERAKAVEQQQTVQSSVPDTSTISAMGQSQQYVQFGSQLRGVETNTQSESNGRTTPPAAAAPPSPIAAASRVPVQGQPPIRPMRQAPPVPTGASAHRATPPRTPTAPQQLQQTGQWQPGKTFSTPPQSQQQSRSGRVGGIFRGR
eukprot:TRINITY_DN2850_c1_g1_i6.p1 TRINITY_DN2850_c1_g1~~TRINITY_DN2850_c1_g1_i6.p1  ORF type:complete len:852 (-),score=137.35 TRINITY_DN2850_c1_g1_i6:288-2843(-)